MVLLRKSAEASHNQRQDRPQIPAGQAWGVSQREGKMKEVNNNKELEMSKSDYVASAAKAALGAVPFVGSFLAEIAGNVIPNQRVERIVSFANKLQTKLDNIEEVLAKLNVNNEDFTDLVEEGLRQAARSTTDDRREYISALIANSLTSEDIDFIESKHLLRLLGEINDIEIIWLRFFLVPTMGGDKEYREKHKEVIKPLSVHMGSSQPEIDKSTLRASYKEHLASLGLLEKRVELDTRSSDVKMKVKGYDLSSLGRLLLRQIGLGKVEEG